MPFVAFYFVTERDERDWKIFPPYETRQEALEVLNSYLLSERNGMEVVWSNYLSLKDNVNGIKDFAESLDLEPNDIYDIDTREKFIINLFHILKQKEKLRYFLLAEGYEIAEIEEIEPN